MSDDAVRDWFERTHPALADALAALAACDALPASDGVIADWVDALCTLRFRAEDVAPVVALIGKPAPHLQEVGVRLAASIIRDLRSWSEIEPAIAALVARGPVDAWVLLAIAELLRATGSTAVAIYDALVRRHGEHGRPGHDGIHRNRHIAPWQELETFYVSCLAGASPPGPRERAILPVLERRFGTRGLDATRAAAHRALGL